MNINKKLIQYNFTMNANSPVYIVIHDTGNPSKGANSEMHYQYFNSGNKDASAHFFVDSTQVLQVVDIKDKSWHCGDGKNKYGIGNGNSIGIEMCINSDGDYEITKTKTLELIQYLMKTYNVPRERVVRHYDASRKNCPASMNKDGNWTEWRAFMYKLYTLEEATKKLVEKGIISSPDYWNTNAKKDGTCKGEYVETLIKNMAKYLG